MRRIGSYAQVIAVDRWEVVLQALRVKQLHHAAVLLLPAGETLNGRHVLGFNDKQITTLNPVHGGRAALGSHFMLEILDSLEAVQRHLDVFRAGELDAAATGGAQRTGELIGRIWLDHADRHARGCLQKVIGNARTDDRATDNCHIVFLHNFIRHLRFLYGRY
ncbi:hypothetical protein D3C81_1535750 [compost metagenome]